MSGGVSGIVPSWCVAHVLRETDREGDAVRKILNLAVCIAPVSVQAVRLSILRERINRLNIGRHVESDGFERSLEFKRTAASRACVLINWDDAVCLADVGVLRRHERRAFRQRNFAVLGRLLFHPSRVCLVAVCIRFHVFDPDLFAPLRDLQVGGVPHSLEGCIRVSINSDDLRHIAGTHFAIVHQIAHNFATVATGF